MNELTYMNYIEESERASFIESKLLDDEFDKLNILYEMVTLQGKLHNIDVENRVLESNGSYDDYAILLMEANEQVSQEKQGIIAKIFEWFAQLFDSIHKAVTSIFAKKVDPKTQVQAPALFSDPQFNSMLNEAVNFVQSNILPLLGSAALSAIGAIFREKILAGLNKVVDWFSKKMAEGGMKAVTAGVLQGITTKLNGIGTSISGLIKNLSSKKAANDNEANDENSVLKGIGNLMREVVNKPISMINKAFSGAAAQPQQNPGNAGAPATDANANAGNAGTAPANNNAGNAGNAGAPATNAGNAGAGGTNESEDTMELQDGELSMFESVFGNIDKEEKKDDDISELLAMI